MACPKSLGVAEAEHLEATISLCAEVPEPLLFAMRRFIEAHPNWDQYRLFKAALAGFLVQNGVNDRGITRCYLANLFPGQGGFATPPRPDSSPAPTRHRPEPGPRGPQRRVA
ncbi:MAG: DUF2811 domain-containing protein [Synechococcaceae cyanobacterium]|jgi:hypothetical protein